MPSPHHVFRRSRPLRRIDQSALSQAPRDQNMGAKPVGVHPQPASRLRQSARLNVAGIIGSSELESAPSVIVLPLGGGVAVILTDVAIVTVVPPGGARMPGVAEVIMHVLDESKRRAASDLPRRAMGDFVRPTECLAAELPLVLVSSVGWPTIGPEFTTTVYPRACFRSLRLSALRGLLAEIHGKQGKPFLLAGIPFWKNGAVKRFLAAARYPVEA